MLQRIPSTVRPTALPIFLFFVATTTLVHHCSLAWVLPVPIMSRNSPLFTYKNNQQRQQDFIDFLQEPMPTTTQPIAIDDDTQRLVETIVVAADGRKAENIVALSVAKVTTLTSVLVIVSGNSRPQNQAIAAAIQTDVDETFELKPGGNGVPEGTADSGWMVLDYGSVMVHIMTPKSRLFYNVEGQWRDKGGKEWDLEHLLVPNTVESSSTSSTGEMVEDDPFWS